MNILRSSAGVVILTVFSLTILASMNASLVGATSESSRWSRTIPQPPPAGAPVWYSGIFQTWLAEERAKGNPLVADFQGNNLKADALLIKTYNQKFQEYEAARAKVATASAGTERRLQEELKVETARREAEELRRKLEEVAKRKAEDDHRQAIAREKLLKEEKVVAEKQISAAKERFESLVVIARNHGVDPSLLNALLPSTHALSAAAEELSKKSRSLASFLQGYIYLLEEIKANESAGEQIKKDYTAVATAVYEGSEHLSNNPGQIAEAVEKTRGTYELARLHKKTLPEAFDAFKALIVRRVTTIAQYEDFMTTNLLTSMSDALERLDGKDSLQLSLDASATFQKFLESLTQQGACAPDFVTPITREINEATKRILAEIKKRNLELYKQYEPSLASEIAKVGRLSPVKKLNKVPSLVQLLEYHPAVFLLIDTNPSLEDVKEDLPKLTVDQLKAVFVYLFDLSEHFREALQRYSELSHTRTKISESDIQQLTGVVKTRIQQAEKVGDYEPAPYQAATEEKEKLTAFYVKAQEFVSGKSYRETIERRFAMVYGPLASFVASCQRADLEAFKAEILSQRGAKGPIEETPTELAARQGLIDNITAFQQRFLALDISTLGNDQLTAFTQQFSDMKAAVEANGDRFKTTFTAFLKRQDPNYTAPIQVVVPRRPVAYSTGSVASGAASTGSSPVITTPPPPPPHPPGTAASTASAPIDPRDMLLEVQNTAALIRFAKTLIDGADKAAWKKANIHQKIKWMEDGTKP